MKALTLIRPWPWAIFWPESKWKDIENRDWKLPKHMLGQRVAIHAGKAYDRGSELGIRRNLNHRPALPVEAHHQGIIGLVTLAGDVTQSGSQWFVGLHGFMLTDRVRLATPVPCKGMLGFWDVPADVEAAVMAQVR